MEITKIPQSHKAEGDPNGEGKKNKAKAKISKDSKKDKGDRGKKDNKAVGAKYSTSVCSPNNQKPHHGRRDRRTLPLTPSSPRARRRPRAPP